MGRANTRRSPSQPAAIAPCCIGHVFPGVGLAICAMQAKRVNDEMFPARAVVEQCCRWTSPPCKAIADFGARRSLSAWPAEAVVCSHRGASTPPEMRRPCASPNGVGDDDRVVTYAEAARDHQAEAPCRPVGSGECAGLPFRRERTSIQLTVSAL